MSRGRNHRMELYFESESIGEMDELLQKEGVEFLHGIVEQPWGQRVLRFYDPDGHVVELGETMESVVKRFHGQGLADEEIVRRTSMPLEFVSTNRSRA
ncbi:MAG TPA: lactoylglutation lyase [Cyanobacteria bacterium UBA8530]|nr:lactoylglutation lyase [Cyanobacteria bacterium UBA8530]